MNRAPVRQKDFNASSRLRTWLNARRKALLDFCCRLIEAPSPNPPGDERRVVEVISAELERLGLDDWEILASKPTRPNALVWVRGTGQGPVLCYAGHTDTKPVGDQRARWKSDPFEAGFRDGRIYGLGSADMKASVAAFIYAAAALRQNCRLRGTLCLALVADEEAGGAFGARYLIQRRKFRPDMAVIGEPSGIEREWEYLHVGQRGSSCFKVKVQGTQRHSSISNLLPTVNASVKMAEVMTALRHEFAPAFEPHPFCPAGVTLNIGVMVRAGVFYGVNPGYAEFSCDIRVLPGMTFRRFKQDLGRFLEKLRARDSSLEVDLEFEKPPLRWTEPTEVAADSPIVAALQASSAAVLGASPPLGLYPATTDSAHFQTLGGIPTIPSFGPGLISVAHGPNEWVGVESLCQAANIYALAAHGLLR